jgi:methylmalonyl-CoA/ethylmalonyl-CoA epimerase
MTETLGSTTLAQVGLIVHDVEATARAWSEIFGLPMPQIKITDGWDITHASYKGEPSPARAKLAFFNVGQVDIELIEPIDGPSTWNDQLQAHGDSLHHLAFRLKDVDEMMAKIPFLESHGLEIVQVGDFLPKGRYLYVDAVDKLGAILELLPPRSPAVTAKVPPSA